MKIESCPRGLRSFGCSLTSLLHCLWIRCCSRTGAGGSRGRTTLPHVPNLSCQMRRTARRPTPPPRSKKKLNQVSTNCRNCFHVCILAFWKLKFAPPYRGGMPLIFGPCFFFAETLDEASPTTNFICSFFLLPTPSFPKENFRTLKVVFDVSRFGYLWV